VACALALLAVSGDAGASFPGKNGRIAYKVAPHGSVDEG